jgi:hypothetical protein
VEGSGPGKHARYEATCRHLAGPLAIASISLGDKRSPVQIRAPRLKNVEAAFAASSHVARTFEPRSSSLVQRAEVVFRAAELVVRRRLPLLEFDVDFRLEDVRAAWRTRPIRSSGKSDARSLA